MESYTAAEIDVDSHLSICGLLFEGKVLGIKELPLPQYLFYSSLQRIYS